MGADAAAGAAAPSSWPRPFGLPATAPGLGAPRAADLRPDGGGPAHPAHARGGRRAAPGGRSAHGRRGRLALARPHLRRQRAPTRPTARSRRPPCWRSSTRSSTARGTACGSVLRAAVPRRARWAPTCDSRQASLALGYELDLARAADEHALRSVGHRRARPLRAGRRRHAARRDVRAGRGVRDRSIRSAAMNRRKVGSWAARRSARSLTLAERGVAAAAARALRRAQSASSASVTSIQITRTARGDDGTLDGSRVWGSGSACGGSRVSRVDYGWSASGRWTVRPLGRVSARSF